MGTDSVSTHYKLEKIGIYIYTYFWEGVVVFGPRESCSSAQQLVSHPVLIWLGVPFLCKFINLSNLFALTHSHSHKPRWSWWAPFIHIIMALQWSLFSVHVLKCAGFESKTQVRACVGRWINLRVQSSCRLNKKLSRVMRRKYYSNNISTSSYIFITGFLGFIEYFFLLICVILSVIKQQ